MPVPPATAHPSETDSMLRETLSEHLADDIRFLAESCCQTHVSGIALTQFVFARLPDWRYCEA